LPIGPSSTALSFEETKAFRAHQPPVSPSHGIGDAGEAYSIRRMEVKLLPFELGFIGAEAESSDSEDELAEAYTEADEVRQGVISVAAAQESHPV
jgi:hypothetical protein